MSIKFNHRNHRGAAMVEFAIIAWVFFLVLFGVIEFGRLLFTYNGLTEIARRGARVAAVCRPNHPAIKNVAIFSDHATGTTPSIVPGITTANIQVRYFNSSGSLLTNLIYPFPAPPVGNGTPSTAYTNYLNDWRALTEGGSIEVSIIGYSHKLLVPINFPPITVTSFATMLPPEAMGVVNIGTTGTGDNLCGFP
jgi:hypothetical protein